jgi:hypothetical protein
MGLNLAAQKIEFVLSENPSDLVEIGTGNETITNNKKLDFTIYLKWNTKTK